MDGHRKESYTPQEVMECRQRMEECDGAKIQSQIEKLHDMQYIFEQNFTELEAHLLTIRETFRDNAEGQSLPYSAFLKVQRDTLRYLFNYLSSAVSLVNHIMTFMSKYKSTSIESSYQKQVISIFPSGLNAFVSEFRNYMIHSTLPRQKIWVDMTQHPVHISAIFPKKDLLDDYNWNEPSKNFILSRTGDCNILQFCRDYHERTVKFYSWFYPALEEYHKKELGEFEKLKNEWKYAHKHLFK